MSRIVLTGGGGFLGWHTRAAALAGGGEVAQLAVGAQFDGATARAAIGGAERVVHIAGVNRATDEAVRAGNVLFAEQLASAILRADAPPREVVFANSVQAGNGTVYGFAKYEAAQILSAAAAAVGAEFHDVHLPNLFGEHGRPFYNAVTSTFCRLLADGGQPEVKEDKELVLLHAQSAADALLSDEPDVLVETAHVRETVSGLLRRLSQQARVYKAGEIPDVSTSFDRDLFNTYRSYTFPEMAPISLSRHSDARGSFVEIIRSHGGTGQSSFSTTVPGVTRGDHFHRRKVERFTVLSGMARISLRRLFTSETVSFEVTGDEPTAVDMPTMWVHNITNTGDETLYTSFWSNDIFDPANPDTIAEVV